ncbi:MAG: hypothetical protein ACRBBP_04870 [Bdellovibrionales bacterium]
MFFKVVFLFAAVFLACCSNNHNFKEDNPVVSLSYDSNCLSSLGKAIELYADELMSETEVKRNFKCVIDAVDYVQVRVKGAEEGVYTASEIKNFLNKFLYKDNKKEIGFYETLLVIKGELFGGEKEKLTFSDLKTLKSFLIEAQDLAVSIRPNASEFLFKNAFSNDVNIKATAKPVIQFLGKWILFQKRNLDIGSILDFLKEADVEIKAQDSWVAFLNLLRSVDSDSKEITNEEKLNFISIFENYYIQAMDLYRGVDGDWEVERESFFEFSSTVDSFLIDLLDSVKSHPEKKWSFKDLTHLTNLISEYEVLSEKLSLDVQEHILKVLFVKYFNGDSGEAVLNAVNFQKIILAWSDINEFLIEAKEVEGHVGTSFPFVREGTDSFSQFTQRRWPSLVRENRTILIPSSDPVVEFTFQSLFHVSWQFLAANILVDAYSEDESRKSGSGGLNLDQVKAAYLDVFVLLKEIGFLDEGSRGGWFRIYNEGNLFVPSAVADDSVTVSEMADYAAYMFSAYFAGDYISDYMEPHCPNFGEDCSFVLVQEKSSEVFESLPGMWRYLDGNTPEKSYARWQKGFEYVAKLTNDDSPYETSHWFRGSVANQYNEVIFRKYDLDRSETLNFEEVSLAYTDFKEALKLLPMVKGTPVEDNDSQLKSLLTLFVKKGKAPKFRNGRPTGTLIRHVAVCGSVYESTNNECTFESDRSKMMSILAYLTKISDEF